MRLGSEKLVFKTVLNFKRVTHFWLCPLETHVGDGDGDENKLLYHY